MRAWLARSVLICFCLPAVCGAEVGGRRSAVGGIADSDSPSYGPLVEFSDSRTEGLRSPRRFLIALLRAIIANLPHGSGLIELNWLGRYSIKSFNTEETIRQAPAVALRAMAWHNSMAGGGKEDKNNKFLYYRVRRR